MISFSLVLGTTLIAMATASVPSLASEQGSTRAIDRLQCIASADAAVRAFIQSDNVYPRNPNDFDLSAEAGGFFEKVKSPNKLTITAVGATQVEGYDYYTITVDLASPKCVVTALELSETDL